MGPKYKSYLDACLLPKKRVVVMFLTLDCAFLAGTIGVLDHEVSEFRKDAGMSQ